MNVKNIDPPNWFKSIKDQLWNDVYVYNNDVIDFVQLCKDEVIWIITVSWWVASFSRLSNYNNEFVSTDLHNQYFKSKKLAWKICMILESPHDKEFWISWLTEFSTWTLINSRPANGPTGDKIDYHISGLIDRMDIKLQDWDYSFSLVNAIQYQTSLWYPTSKYRDDIFLELIRKPTIINSLLSRINSIDADVYINSCTKWEFSLNWIVLWLMLPSMIKNWKKLYFWNHPSSFIWKKVTTLDKKLKTKRVL